MIGVIATSFTVSMLTDGTADDFNIELRLVCDGEVNSVAATASSVSILTGEAVSHFIVRFKICL